MWKIKKSVKFCFLYSLNYFYRKQCCTGHHAIKDSYVKRLLVKRAEIQYCSPDSMVCGSITSTNLKYKIRHILPSLYATISLEERLKCFNNLCVHSGKSQCHNVY